MIYLFTSKLVLHILVYLPIFTKHLDFLGPTPSSPSAKLFNNIKYIII